MQKAFLFLDDEREPEQVDWVVMPKTWHTIVVRNFDTFRAYIHNNPMPDWISFDHDLAPAHYEAMMTNGDYRREKTGLDCAKWLADYCHRHDEPFPQYSVHSLNPVGRQNIERFIQCAKKEGYVR